MNKRAVFLIFGGAAIVAIALGGNHLVNRKSDEQVLQEAIWEAQQAEQAAQEEVSKLRRVVLESPQACSEISSSIFAEMCERYEDDPGTAPAWSARMSETTKSCVLDAFHATNEHAYKLIQETYEHKDPTDSQMYDFACAVSGAWIEADIGYGDTEATATQLLQGFYQERAKQNFSLPRTF